MVVVLGDPSLHRYVGGRPLGLEELERRYERQSRGSSEDESERWFNWIIRDRSSREAVGYVQATVETATRIADGAWVVGSRYQGRGYAREAARAMLWWLHGQGVSAVTARIHPDNRASERVARALGLSPTPATVDGEVVWAGASLSEDELTDLWERQELGGSGVSHIDHVRVAWVLHRRHGPPEAEERLVRGTRKGCDHYGVPEKFDEGLTRRWAQGVSEAIAGAPESESFEEFIARNPELRRGDLFGKPNPQA
jgi:RimJ/RimL family protein N-acetyltransferase